ncbi:MAG: hypothetical protein ACYTF6_00030 [Planctomycetota bacterium]|jgi:hypothetical protein
MSEQTKEHSDEADTLVGASKLVPVAESIKYRRRAQQAESRIKELEQSLTELQTQLENRNEELAAAKAQHDEARHRLSVAENRIVAERLLSEAGVIDLETASILLAKRVDLGGEMDRDSLARSVEQLILEKPFLHGSTGASLPPASASAKPPQSSPAAKLTQVAERAAQTGDRKDVAEYLRLRRRATTGGSP